MRSVVAAIATVCLLSASACTWTAGRSTKQSRMMDGGFLVAGLIAAPYAACEVRRDGSEDGCMAPAAGFLMIGVPVLVGVAIAASSTTDEQDDAVALRDDALPARATDDETLRLARQVQSSVHAKQCGAANAAMERIAERDADFHIAMLAKGVLGTCALSSTGREPGAYGASEAPSMTPQYGTPLPTMATDARTLRLAKQARSAAGAGRCAAVEVAMTEIARRDPRYHAALARSGALGACW